MAVSHALRELSANPGRGGHRASVRAGETVYAARQKAADFFGAAGADQVVFTASCTSALNMAIKGNVQSGDHMIISSMEHNAVARPAYALHKRGVQVDVAEVIFGDPAATVRSFERLIRAKTKLIVCTHSSNVTGEVMPIAQLGALCRSRGILFVVDAAQTAGVLEIDVQKMNIDYLCVAPHKGLYAPMGTGILVAQKVPETTIIEGGTGVASAMPTQPWELPERLEAGTVNLPGIAGIAAGLDFVRQKGPEKLYRHELELIRQAYSGLSKIRGVRLYTPMPAAGRFTPVLSFNLRDQNSNSVAAALDKMGICARGGLHCAPSAHKRLGTLETGTVRISTAVFNTPREIEQLVQSVWRISQQQKKP